MLLEKLNVVIFLLNFCLVFYLLILNRRARRLINFEQRKINELDSMIFKMVKNVDEAREYLARSQVDNIESKILLKK